MAVQHDAEVASVGSAWSANEINSGGLKDMCPPTPAEWC